MLLVKHAAVKMIVEEVKLKGKTAPETGVSGAVFAV
jgi:hypothetical protein